MHVGYSSVAVPALPVLIHEHYGRFMTPDAIGLQNLFPVRRNFYLLGNLA
jgi:hypothetical protein